MSKEKLSNIKIKELDEKESKEFVKIFSDAKYGTGYKIFAAMLDGGYIGGIIINNDPVQEVYKKHNLKPEVAISFLFVLDKYREAGLGNKLLQRILKNYKKICLSTSQGWSKPQAYHLYEKNGFEKVEEKGRTTFWYHN
ncbi:MAG: GNAT family N-acetyltransferase [Patescibacteria group bacterium]